MKRLVLRREILFLEDFYPQIPEKSIDLSLYTIYFANGSSRSPIYG